MQPHANTRPHPQGGGERQLPRRRQERRPPLLGTDCNNTKHKDARRRVECKDCARLQTLLFFSRSFSFHHVFLSFASLPARKREREREKEKSAERPGREMYCTFLRTRCIDCHTSVPEKRHCAIERDVGPCVSPSPPKRAGKGDELEPQRLRQHGLRPLPAPRYGAEVGEGESLELPMLSASKQRSRRGADDVCACSRRQRTGSPEKHACDRREGRRDDPRESLRQRRRRRDM